MTKRETAQGQDKYIVRLPEGMRDGIKAAAFNANRSMNTEIVARIESGGETLRDRFAMAALTGYLSRPDADDHNYDEIVDWCFDAADAAIARRKVGA